MSLINQMLQDLDAQEGSERQPIVPEIAAAPVKGRSVQLPGLLGMLLAAALGAGVTWVLGQPKSVSPEGGVIPLALPDPLVAGKRRENHRPPTVVLQAAPTGLSQQSASDGIPVGSKSKDTNPAGRSVEAPAEVVVEQRQVFQERPNVLVAAVEAKPEPEPEPREKRVIPTGGQPTHKQQVSDTLSSAKTKKSGQDKPEKRPSVKAVSKPYRTFGKDKAVPDLVRDARLYIRQGRLAEAEEVLQRTLRANPGTRQAREILAALLLRGGRRSEAATLLDEGLQLAPGQPVFLGLRARLYREQGDTDQAIALLQQGLRDGRDNGDLLELLGVLYQEEGRFSEAAVVYRRALKQRPDSANSWAGLAISLDAAGEQATALQAYRRAMAKHQLPEEVADYVRQRVSLLESQ